MSLLNVDKVDPQSGTALEIGTSGDTVTVPSGVGLTLTDSTLLLPTTIQTDKLDPKSGTALEIGTSGDTITVPTGAGLTVTDEVKTNKISPATGVAFALGDSGDTFTVPSGATITNNGTATGFGGGKILQVVSAADSTSRATTSTSYVTGSNTLSVAITPASTSNKVFVIVTTVIQNSGSSENSMFSIFRDSTNLGDTIQGMVIMAPNLYQNSSMSVVDSPSSTSELTYQLYMRGTDGNTSTCVVAGAVSSITAMEIDGT